MAESIHIAIDGRELVGRPTGVGRYVLEVLRRWAAKPDGPRYTIVLPAEPGDDLRRLGPRFHFQVEPDPVAGTWWEQTTLRRVVARLQPDVLFAPAYTAPIWCACPVVVVIHDVSYFAHPEWFRAREGLRRRVVTRAVARRSRAVLTVSEFSRQEIARHIGLPAGALRLASPGAPPADPPDERPRPPLVLSVGSLFNRRRLPEMIEGFARAAATIADATFVLAGDNRTSPPLDPRRLAASTGAADRIDYRSYVSDVDLLALYRSARVLLFLSDYEGFGMPPLEALAHGVAPVVLETAISREIYGDGAVRVEPRPDAVARAIASLLEDEAHRAAVVAAGRARLAAFSWAATAGTIAAALDEAAR